MKTTRLFLGMMIAGLALGSSAAAQNSPASQSPIAVADARLEPGDIIRITVWRKPEYSGEFTIDASGTPRHPLYRNVKVVGIPLTEVEARLVKFLTVYEQNPQIVVEPLFRVTVGGEVTIPNLYTLPRETTVLQAIALAGGPTTRGSLNKVRIIRGGQSIEADVTKPAAEWANKRIVSGDQIIVTRKRNWLADFITPIAAVVGATAAIVNIAKK